MNVRKVVLTIGVLAVVAGGSYAAYDYYAGNHITIQQVIPTHASAPSKSATAAEPAKLDGQWTIQPASKVYLSVTTSKETVNIEGASVKGSWTINTIDTSQMKAEGIVDTKVLQSGNPQEDNHVKGKDGLNVANFPEAQFTVKSFGNFPKDLKEGTKASFTMAGTLTIKDISKDVVFTSEALYNQGALNVEGSTVVTFADYGMKNPAAPFCSKPKMM